ncbi:hypothetical protein AUQ48_05315 [Kocuria flava]|uniref:Uncharacterized protein n=1 Tax=Kocuria flava TaxID=446860 RepID=A0A2N4T0K9_9MICC|nr:hypothetical protein AUQ48_05315 [Kocuria flava]
MSTVTGARIAARTRRMRTNSPTSGIDMISSRMLPTYIEFTTPQNSSGSCSTSWGPGVTPWMSSAPNIRAMVALAGIPRVSSGMKELVAAALLAVSGPATPSTAPRPKRSGRSARFFSIA